jgi:pyridoxine/pyridoxamine 5'-phosphate oxidase
VSDVPSHDPTGLTETDLGPGPVARIVAWLDDARAAGVRFPEAAALATADAQGTAGRLAAGARCGLRRDLGAVPA